MATFNLVRNSRVFFTTNVNSIGRVGVDDSNTNQSCTTSNTQELQVLDGFTFGQTSNADTITISEAGATPTRGQRSFNTSLGQADFSFSTYIRPHKVTSPATLITAEEASLWNALLGSVALGSTAALDFTVLGTGATATPVSVAWASNVLTFATDMTVGGAATIVAGETLMITGHTLNDHNTAIKIVSVTAGTSGGFTATWLSEPSSVDVTATTWTDVKLTRTAWNSGATRAEVTTALSNKNQLVKFGMIMVVDGITYAIDNCCMNQAVIDFGLDGIATIAWTGMGTALRQVSPTVVFAAPGSAGSLVGGTVTGGIIGSGYVYKNTAAEFITNKLSTVSLRAGINGTGAATNLALTGGSITINNNITYVTPANLGVVNLPVGYYTGTRAISGSVTAYLRTGSTNTAGLLSTLLGNAASSAGIEPKYQLILTIGGSAASTKVEVEVPMAFLQIPTIDAAAVMSTTINFTAEGSSSVYNAQEIDIENTNELEIRYIKA